MNFSEVKFPGHSVICGITRSGKTYRCKEIFRAIPDDEFAIFIDFKGVDDWGTLWETKSLVTLPELILKYKKNGIVWKVGSEYDSLEHRQIAIDDFLRWVYVNREALGRVHIFADEVHNYSHGEYLNLLITSGLPYVSVYMITQKLMAMSNTNITSETLQMVFFHTGDIASRRTALNYGIKLPEEVAEAIQPEDGNPPVFNYNFAYFNSFSWTVFDKDGEKIADAEAEELEEELEVSVPEVPSENDDEEQLGEAPERSEDPVPSQEENDPSSGGSEEE